MFGHAYLIHLFISCSSELPVNLVACRIKWEISRNTEDSSVRRFAHFSTSDLENSIGSFSMIISASTHPCIPSSANFSNKIVIQVTSRRKHKFSYPALYVSCHSLVSSCLSRYHLSEHSHTIFTPTPSYTLWSVLGNCVFFWWLICFAWCLFLHVYDLIVHSLTCLQRDKQDRRRLICAVATEPLPKQVEESKMDTPKEIFLKDYKLPDYYFDSVCKNLLQFGI